jgi:LPS-assembly lipoprotein
MHPLNGGAPVVSATMAITLVLGLTACGFHLRTWDVGTSIESAYVASDARNPLEAPLKRALRQAGVAAADSAGQAEIVVELLDSRHERRSVSVSGQARAAEYETTLGIQYRVTDGQGQELVPAQWLERQRVFRVDRDNIVGSSEEQALLEREMQSDLVQQILRALNAVAVAAADAG